MRHLIRRTAIVFSAAGIISTLAAGAQAGTIPALHFRDLVAGQQSFTYGDAVGVWSCWKDKSLDITMYAMDTGGAWQSVSTDTRLTTDPTNCNVPGLPYLAVNAWTVNIRGSQASGVARGVLALGLGWKSVGPTSDFTLAPTGQVPASSPKVVQWQALGAGTSTLPLGGSVSVAYPGCQGNLYALDNAGLLGSWQKVASGCADTWRVRTPGSQGVGAQTGLTLLAAAPAKPQYTYGLVKIE
jgi:hypothetical protein